MGKPEYLGASFLRKALQVAGDIGSAFTSSFCFITYRSKWDSKYWELQTVRTIRFKFEYIGNKLKNGIVFGEFWISPNPNAHPEYLLHPYLNRKASWRYYRNLEGLRGKRKLFSQFWLEARNVKIPQWYVSSCRDSINQWEWKKIRDCSFHYCSIVMPNSC